MGVADSGSAIATQHGATRIRYPAYSAGTQQAWIVNAAGDAYEQQDVGATGLSLLAAGTAAAGRTALSLGSAALSDAGDFAAASHNHDGTYADLVGGVIPSSQIPAIAITEPLGEADDQAEMLTLTGQKGDWCIRTDTGTTWVITGDDPTQLADWTELGYPTAPVTSVNSQTGAVTLAAADVGAAAASHTHAASDITSGTVATARLGSGTASSSTYLRGDQTWQTISAGIGGSTGGVDNAILRADGTGGSTVQASGPTINDAGDLSIGTAQLNFGHPSYYLYRSGTSVVFEAGGAYAFNQAGATKMTIGSTGVAIRDTMTASFQTVQVRQGTLDHKIWLYQTYTDAANYSRMELNTVASGDAELKTSSAGTGTRRNIVIDPASYVRMTKRIELADIGSDPTLTAGYSAIYGKDVSSSNEVFVEDEGGNVTQVSPHATDGPEAIYTTTPGHEAVLGTANVYRGEIRWTNLERASLAPVVETFAEYNDRRGLSEDDPEYKRVRDWDAAQQDREDSVAELQAGWDADADRKVSEYRTSVRQWLAKPQAKRQTTPIPQAPELSPRPEAYKRKERPAWLSE